MKTKIIKTVFFMFIFYSFASNSLICKDIINYEINTEKEKSDSISDSTKVVSDPVYDFIIFELYEYYRSYYKYPDNMDTFVNYLYYKSLYLAKRDLGRNTEDVKSELEQLKQKQISLENRQGLLMSQIVFNYCYVHKNETQFIYEEDFIALVCSADSIYFTYKKPNACIDRNSNNLSNNVFGFVPPSERIRFYNNTGQVVFVDYELIHALYKSIHEIINERYRDIWQIDDKRPIITAILKYNKKDGLSSFCPDDNIDVEYDPFFIEVRDILDCFISENKDIYEIIIPMKCCESRRI
ncbi:MAG: hypothetical protein LBC68_10490 [Prevotellaceae bacterium]|jgi:hypothetical protein|nr:hypothetical protein [Prevotellaceae bacterium]